jgi:hypothetical protein
MSVRQIGRIGWTVFAGLRQKLLNSGRQWKEQVKRKDLVSSRGCLDDNSLTVTAEILKRILQQQQIMV